MNRVLTYFDYVFTAAFVVEMIVKVVSCGFCLHPGSYIREPWNVLDFIVVVSALLSYLMQAVTSSNTVVEGQPQHGGLDWCHNTANSPQNLIHHGARQSWTSRGGGCCSYGECGGDG